MSVACAVIGTPFRPTDRSYIVDSADESRKIRDGNSQGDFKRQLQTNLSRLNAKANPGARGNTIFRMLKTTLIAALLLLSLTAMSDPAEEVRCHEIAFSKAAENKDAEAFRSFLDEDARFVGSIVTRGPDEIVAAWQPFFSADGPAIKWRPQFIEVRNDGDLALTRGPYRMVNQDPDGNPVEYWGTFNSIWRKTTKGHWQVIFDAGNSASKPPDSATRALLKQDDNCE